MPERNCVGCTKQELWGCTAKRWKDHPPNEPDHPGNWVAPAQHPVTLMGETFYSCPRQHMRENPGYWGWMLKFYGLYKKGFLPSTGGILEQSNKAIEVFRVLDDANDQCDRAEAEKQRAQQNRRGPPQRGPGPKR